MSAKPADKQSTDPQREEHLTSAEVYDAHRPKPLLGRWEGKNLIPPGR